MNKNKSNQDKVAQKILDTLKSQKFDNWYRKGAFEHYIAGDLPPIRDCDILEAIKDMFQLD